MQMRAAQPTSSSWTSACSATSSMRVSAVQGQRISSAPLPLDAELTLSCTIGRLCVFRSLPSESLVCRACIFSLNYNVWVPVRALCLAQQCACGCVLQRPLDCCRCFQRTPVLVPAGMVVLRMLVSHLLAFRRGCLLLGFFFAFSRVCL